MGKGSNRRPSEVDYEAFCKNWEKIFGKGSGGDLREVLDTEKADRPAIDPGDEGVTPEVEGG